MARKRGGYQKPERPAAVSGPGALSQRTDRGQPIRVAPGGNYGERKALEAQQAAAPMATSPAPAGGEPAVRSPGPPLPDVFAPSDGPRPGVDMQPPPPAPDPYAFIAAAYSVYPDPALAALLQRRR